MKWNKTKEVSPKRNGKYVVYTNRDGMDYLKYKKDKWYKFLDDVTYPVKSPEYWYEIIDGPWV